MSKDLHKYEKIRMGRYFGKCPEGIPQAIRKDLALYRPGEKEFGIMVRPQALQIIRQLESFSTEKDPMTGTK